MFGVQRLGYRLHELYDITWSQFQLESEAWRRREEERVKEYQYLNYMITWAPHRDPKQLPTSFDQFRGKAPEISEELQNWFKADMEKFRKAQNKKAIN